MDEQDTVFSQSPILGSQSLFRYNISLHSAMLDEEKSVSTLALYHSLGMKRSLFLAISCQNISDLKPLSL